MRAFLGLLMGLSLALAANMANAQAATGRAWMEYVGADVVEVRAITAADRCPDAQVDGQAQVMTERSAPDPAFPVRVCALRPATGAKQVAVGDDVFTLPAHAAQRILIFGDTGCRLKGKAIQDCNDPRAWPFAEVARRAAAFKPDVVIHVGDYYYRESPCPPEAKGCAGSPHGDTWASWDADFFTPATPLLATSPWVFARGNHEDCNRGAPGWFKFLDAGAQPLTCPATSAPFAVDLGGLNLYVIDGANADDLKTPDGPVKQFSGDLDALKAQLTQGKGWLVTHRPIWALVPAHPAGIPIDVKINATEQAAVRGHDLAGVQMIVAGHIHHFAAIDFGPKRPAQLVAGTGGDVGEADEPAKPVAKPTEIDGMKAGSFSFERYGYLLMERHGDDWDGVFRDMDDKVVANCRLHARRLNCKTGPAA